MVEIQLTFFDQLRLCKKFVSHKLQQYMLGTNETEVITTNYGQVKGLKRRTVYEEDGFYYAFEGIPYAKPPLGDLRFRAPQPAEPWTGIRDCTNMQKKPMQKHFAMKIVQGAEDCLYLNIYAKTLKTDKPLPVLVWIYGGGFQIGEATRDMYAPDYFMKKDVVLVTLNYRVGALGFLSLQDPDLQVPGNAGLKDQVMALRWIKQNIRHFNGDDENITIFGESAGGASVHFMLITEQSKNLFHKAIMQSGSVFCPWGFPQLPNLAFRLAAALGYKGTENKKEIFSFLKKIDAAKIATYDNRLLTIEEKRAFQAFTFLPVVEPYLTTDCIVPKHPREMLRHAWSNNIPIMLGGTSFEGLFAYQQIKFDPQLIEQLADCVSLVPIDAKVNCSNAEIKSMASQLRLTHLTSDVLNFKNCFYQLLDFVSYYYFWHGLHRAMLARLAYASKASTFLYRFDFDSVEFNHFRNLTCGRTQRGVAHADDLSYLFYNVESNKLSKDSLEYKTIDRMINLWTSFAATSNPNCDQIKPVEWTAVQPSDNEVPKCLNISAEVALIELPEWQKLKIWDSLYRKDTLF